MRLRILIRRGLHGRYRWFVYGSKDGSGPYRGSSRVWGFASHAQAFADAVQVFGSPVFIDDADGYENFAGYRDFAD